MNCVLCRQPIALWELSEWCGEPVHDYCASSARDAFDEACERIAAENRRRLERRAERRESSEVA